MRAVRFVLSVLLLVVLTAACDSSGGGDSPDTVTVTDTVTDTVPDSVPAPDTGSVTDTASDTETASDTKAVPDTAPFPDTAADTGPDTTPDPCAALDDGTPCDDDDPCTWDDRCLGGRCEPGAYDACQGGDCGPALPLACNLEVHGSTVGAPNAVNDWGCASVAALAGPERVYRFEAPYLLEGATVALVTEAEDLQLLVLNADGEQVCAPDDCASASHLGAAINAAPGEVLYFAVDGTDPAGADYTLAIGCPQPIAEIACGDGLDNDEDGATDCDDDDCPDDPHCDGTAGACVENYFAACGLQEIWSTASTSAANINENYACSAEDFSGLEYVYKVWSPSAQRVTVTLSDPDPWELVPTGHVLILEGKCGPDACIEAGSPSVEFTMQANTDYFVVVDSTRGLAGFFHISIDCSAN